MAVKQIDVQEASRILDTDPGCIYLDVRTESEFRNGHVPNAINIPVVLPSAGGMAPNPEFLKVVEANVGKERKVIVGCQAGMRSQYAGDIMIQAEYVDVSNMQGGFGGARDTLGRTIAPGWVETGLPVEMKVDESNSYEAARKRGK